MKVVILTVDDIITHKEVYFETLGHLTQAPMMTDDDIIQQYNRAIHSGSYFFGCFDDQGELVGISTLVVEYKFIRGGAICGHIEDVATRPGYEGQGVGKLLMQTLITKATELGCYKIILDCHEHLIPFYEQSGFYLAGVQMRKDLLPII